MANQGFCCVTAFQIDFEATGTELCLEPGNCIAETQKYYHFLTVLSEAFHEATPPMEVSVDWATFMGVSNYGSLEGLRETSVDTICSMDPVRTFAVCL